MTTGASTLPVPGARLHWERRGSGPVLLMIAGSNGDAALFDAVADLLSDGYTVVTYDRRGYSRSPLDGAADGEWIDLHREDARRLLTTVAGPGGSGYVFGSSAGAVIALDLISRHPDLVEKVVAHEPPLAAVLPDSAKWVGFFRDVYDTYRRSGVQPAMAQFITGIGIEQGARQSVVSEAPPELVKRLMGNLEYFLAHEVREATGYQPDLAALDAARDRIVLAGGEDSREQFPYRPNTILAQRFGRPVIDLPGDHLGYSGRPEPFAAKLRELLAAG